MTTNKSEFIKLIKGIIKETISLIYESKFQRGEWWIYPGGTTEFADGDIGDSNHEAIVIRYLTGEILSHFGIDTSMDIDVGCLADYEDNIKQSLVDEERLSPEELEEWDLESPSEIILRKLIEDKVYKDEKQAEDALYIAYGSSSRDGRDYAMKYLNWKRLDTKNKTAYIQTWNLTSSDLSDISKGLYEVENEDFGAPEEDNEIEVNVEVMSNKLEFNDIPLEVIHRRNIKDIILYRRKIGIYESKLHSNKEWIIYEGDNKITAVFEDNSKLFLEIHYHNNRGDDKEKWKHKAASKWKLIAREIYNNSGLTDKGNKIIRSWKECFEEALKDERLKDFIKKETDVSIFP